VEIAASAVKWTSAKVSMDAAAYVFALVVMDPLVNARRIRVFVLIRKDAAR